MVERWAVNQVIKQSLKEKVTRRLSDQKTGYKRMLDDCNVAVASAAKEQGTSQGYGGNNDCEKQ